MSKLRISTDLSLPIDFVTSTQAILAKRGVGKSHTASVEAEEMLKAHLPIIAIDPTGAWYGLKSSKDGKSAGYPIAIFGGEHADVPLEDTAGETIATAIVRHRFSAIIDLSLLRKGQWYKFLAPFLETLYLLNREAVHLFVDEAHKIAPQKIMGGDVNQSRVLGAMEDIGQMGRRKGIGCTLITQRPAVLNKNVLTQCELLCVMRLIHNLDIDAVKEWIDVHGDKDKAKQLISDLPSLPVGTAWFWSPGMSPEIFAKVHIRERETFDSGATPELGKKLRPPKVLAQVDLQQLGEQIAATVQRAKEADPNILKRKVAELEKQLAAEKLRTVKPAAQQKVTVKGIEKIDREKLFEIVREETERIVHDSIQPKMAGTIGSNWSKLAKYLRLVADDLEINSKAICDPADEMWKVASISKVARDQSKSAIAVHNPAIPVIAPTLPVSPIRPIRERSERPISDSAGSQSQESLVAGAMRMLAACSTRYPKGLTAGQVASQAGIKKRGGSFRTYKSMLVTRGLIEVQGNLWLATELGMAEVGSANTDAPQSTDEVLNLWLPKLQGKAKDMLEAIVRRKGHAVSYDDLADEVGIEAAGGSFRTYMSSLMTTGLIVKPDRRMVAANTEALFM